MVFHTISHLYRLSCIKHFQSFLSVQIKMVYKKKKKKFHFKNIIAIIHNLNIIFIHTTRIQIENYEFKLSMTEENMPKFKALEYILFWPT